MLLRDHPLMSYRGVPNWPPAWTWVGGIKKKRAKGEIGILKLIQLSTVLPPDRCYLYIDHEGSLYIGCLLFDEDVFCRQIVNLLQRYRNLPVAEIGSLDLSHML